MYEECIKQWASDLNPNTARNYVYYFLKYLEWNKREGYWKDTKEMIGDAVLCCIIPTGDGPSSSEPLLFFSFVPSLSYLGAVATTTRLENSTFIHQHLSPPSPPYCSLARSLARAPTALAFFTPEKNPSAAHLLPYPYFFFPPLLLPLLVVSIYGWVHSEYVVSCQLYRGEYDSPRPDCSLAQLCNTAINPQSIKIDNGEYVPSLTPVSGSGGSGDLYYTVC